MVMRSDKRENSVYLSLGTNLGDRLAYLKDGIARLQVLSTQDIELSNIYESQPWGNELLNYFLNCVVHIRTNLQPHQLLIKTQGIEREMGRDRKSRGKGYQNRVIDIDILTHGNATVDSNGLTIPHPLIARRRFVLLPLSDLAPELILPYSSESIRKSLSTCEDSLTCTKFDSL
tara:strand:+ start:58007 stop:58528 length:522 start_codon:yes stop_codon:yes gene_type:complete